MQPIRYVNRLTKKESFELVYGSAFLELLYGDSLLSRIVGKMALPPLAKTSFFSWLYGWLQRLPFSKSKIKPFVKKFAIDSSEFLEDISSYKTFDAFFTRRLKPEARPIFGGSNAIIPADGRYLFYSRIDQADGFVVKGKKFQLEELLLDQMLAERYQKGSMVIARLCPSDYHRFHFPCEGIASPTRTINGWLFSVNPIAIKRNVKIFTENKRTLCELDTLEYGKILFLEIGAKCVGRITQTYSPGRVEKGEGKGYFSFGASSLILLFEPGAIQFDNDLLELSQNHQEVLCLMGQSMGIPLSAGEQPEF